MTIYYADTSAVVKRYVIELGSAWVKQVAMRGAGNTIFICQLTQVEVFSALERKKHGGSLSEADSRIFQFDFLADSESEYGVVTVNHSVFSRARVLVTQHRKLKSLDAIQLASAIELAEAFDNPITFMSADVDLLNAAQKEGFSTENPEDHP